MVVLLDILSRIRPRSRSRSLDLSIASHRCFIVSFPRPVDAMLVFDSRIIYNRGGHATARLRANTRNTAYVPNK